LELLSNIELYFSPDDNISDGVIAITGEEFKHAAKVMRNKVGDILYITNGKGSIFKCKILSIGSDRLSARIINVTKSKNKLENIFFCIPKLKNPDRFKFTLEKCVELGIVNFIVFESQRSVAKGSNIKRWEKITLAAMKQSLRLHLPGIQLVTSLTEIVDLPGEKLIFEQNAKHKFRFKNDREKNYFFIFGPEGGFTDKEINLFDQSKVYSVGESRLRSETASVKVASLL
jgi:16S rRNA (uracil1498-N3)-methyltransferase